MDTRRSGEDEAAFSGTNQLGNQLGARLTTGINNSQSTPSLTRPVKQTSVENKQSTTRDEEQQPSENVEKQNTPAQITATNEHQSILRRGQARMRLVNGVHTTSNGTGEPSRQRGESTNKSVPIEDRLAAVTNEEPELSDVEQNAEATDQPAETGEALVNTGSVNTLSSSPLRSADEDEDRNSDEEEKEVEEEQAKEEKQLAGDGQYQRDTCDRTGEFVPLREISEVPAGPESRPIASKRSTRPTGNWLGPGGIKPYTEAVDLGQTEPNESPSANAVIPCSVMNKNTVDWVQNGGEFAPPIPSSPPPFIDEMAPTHSSGTVTISIAPNMRQSTAHVCTKSSVPAFRSADFTTTIKKSDSLRAPSQPRGGSPPPADFTGTADVEDYIDSSERSPPVSRVTSVTNVTQSHITPTGHVTDQTYSTNQNLYFPYARTVRLGGSTRSRSQDYKALAAIPSRRSPTRRDIRISGQAQPTAKQTTNEPQEISLSAENFTRAEPEQPLLISAEPQGSARAELIARARREERGPALTEASRRSCDLSPQPRDWLYDQHQQQQRQQQQKQTLNGPINSSTESNRSHGISELIISPTAERFTGIENYMDRSAAFTSQLTTKAVCDETCTHSVAHPCGLLDSTLPSWSMRQREIYTPEIESSILKKSNDLFLNHGYRAVTQTSPKTEGFSIVSDSSPYGSIEFAKASSSAAQLAAGASTRPYRTVSPVIGPCTSPPRVERQMSPVHGRSVNGAKRPVGLNFSVRVDGYSKVSVFSLSNSPKPMC